MRTEPRNPARYDGVDVLRGISILAVILLHIAIRMRIAGFRLDPMLPPWLFHLLFWNGNNGVTIFFAVSGFLITTTSMRRFGSLAKMRPARFYRIRFARIAPSLLLLLAILSVLHLAGARGFVIEPVHGTLARALLAALTFHLNWFEGAHGYLPPNWDILWSLSIEEMFYLFFPLVCVLLLRLRRGAVFFVVLLLALIAIAPWQRVVTAPNGIWAEKSYFGNMDGIAFGCLAALLTDRLRHVDTGAWRRWVGLSGAAMILLIFVWPPHWGWLRFIGRNGLDGTILALGASLVIVATVLAGSSGGALLSPVRWLGRHSYEVYLTHEFAVVWGTMLYVKTRSGPLPVWVVVIALVSIVPGAFLAKYFSEPLNRRLRGAA